MEREAAEEVPENLSQNNTCNIDETGILQVNIEENNGIQDANGVNAVKVITVPLHTTATGTSKVLSLLSRKVPSKWSLKNVHYLPHEN
jgi:hypothetical protein